MMKKLLSLVLALMCSMSIWADDFEYPEHLYLVGDATPAGWNIDATNLAKTTMNQTSDNSHVYVWTGKLSATASEGFKITESVGYNNWHYLHPSSSGFLINEKDDVLHAICPTDNGHCDFGDTKWKVSVTGTYTVTVKITDDNGNPTIHVSAVQNIATLDDLKAFADNVNTNASATAAKAILTADITDAMEYGIGWYNDDSNNRLYSGTFDGQGHYVNLAINKPTENNQGLFGAVTSGATIRNVIVKGFVDGKSYVGGVVAATYKSGNVLIENCGNEAAVTSFGGQNAAGILGVNMFSEAAVTIKNCYNSGSITGKNYNGTDSKGDVASICAWLGDLDNGSGRKCYVYYCYNAAEVKIMKDDSETKYTDIVRRNKHSGKNENHLIGVYNKNAIEGKMDDGNLNGSYYGNPLTDAMIQSGELCFKLNNEIRFGTDWYQTLGVDHYPVPFSSHKKVCRYEQLNCDGTSKDPVDYRYTNNDWGNIKDNHAVEGGFCNYCNKMIDYEEDYMTPASDGWYEISDNKQMRWFAAKVKSYRVDSNDDSNALINARLMNDIDFEGVKDYQPIGELWGQGGARYAGEFDGQFHKIKNLNIDLDKNNVGIFGVIAEGAVIKNFTVDATCSITGKDNVGIIGQAWRSHNGEFHLLCLGNEANITGHKNVGGILGVNMNNSGYAKCNMCHCYTTGSIVGETENGQLTGWSGDEAYIENCYAIGESTKCDGFARLGNRSTVKNCYCDQGLTWDGHPTQIDEDWLTSGKLCVALNKGTDVWKQTVGVGHPTFNGNVVVYVSDALYSTYYDSKQGYTTDLTAKKGVLNNDKFRLEEIDDIPAGCGVVLKADEKGYYNLIPVETTSADASNNQLKGTDKSEAIANDESYYYYALSLNASNELESVGFYWMNADGSAFTNGAHKAYLMLQKSMFEGSNPIKGFSFNVDDDETAIDGISEVTGKHAIYNVAGQRISQMQRGVNIINGKKILY